MRDTQMIKLRFPADKRYLGMVASLVQELCNLVAELPPSSAYNVQLAVDEAVVNIIEHAYDDDPNGIVEISASMERNRLMITLCDWGASFEPAAIPAPDLSAPHEHGYGVYLIRELMDEVHYERTPSSNCVTLVKRF